MERNRWCLVVAVGVAVFMATLDMSIVALALPVIEREFHTSTSTTQWVLLGYLLPLIALALPSGRWLDRVGRRAALTFSVTGFAVASVAAGLAPGIDTLIGARIVQGAFGAVLFALTPALATAGLILLAFLLAMAVFGLVAGALADRWGSRRMSSAPGELLGTAGASISLARQLGFALGPALATAVWAAAGYTLAGMRAALALAAAVSVLAVLALARTWPATTHAPAVAVEAAVPSPASSH